MRQGREGAHRFPEPEMELEQVGEVSLAGSRAAGHSCWRKETSVRGVSYYNLQAQPVKWPSVDGLLIYRPFNSTAHHYLINANELGRILQLQRRWGPHSFSRLQRALTSDDFTFRARHWFGWKSLSLWLRTGLDLEGDLDQAPLSVTAKSQRIHPPECLGAAQHC